MQFNLFRVEDLFLETGVIDYGCKIIVGNRLNDSSMRWTKSVANILLYVLYFVFSLYGNGVTT